MIDNTDSASGLPIKDEAELAIEARARQLMEQYDISMEEALRMARGEMLESMDAPEPEPSAEDRLAMAHEAVGMPVDRARRLARNQVGVYGEQGANEFADRRMTPEGREFGAAAWAEQQKADARHQQMYDDYFRATGAPSHQSIPADEVARDEYRKRYNQLYDSYRRDGVHSQQPIDPGTPEQNAEWDAFLQNNPEQMARYRPDDYAASQAAADQKRMADVFKNIRQKYGPDEEARARAAYAEGKVHVPQTDGQRSRNEARRNLENAAMRGGDNSDESRQRLRAMEAGVHYDDPGMTDEDRAALRAPGGNMSDSRRAAMMRRLRVQAGVTGKPGAEGKTADQLRELIAAKREDEKKAKELLWRPRTMIRGGNAIGALALPGLTPGQEAAMLGGPTPLAVEAARNAQLTELGLRVAQGRGFQDNTDLQLVMMQQRQREAAIARADQLIKKYPQGWDGKYEAGDVEEVRNAVERQHPGMGDAAVAHIRVRPVRGAAAGAASGGGTGAPTTLPSSPQQQPGTTGLPEAGPAPPGWPIGRPWPPLAR